MTRVSRRRAAAVLISFAFVAAACGSSSKSSSSTPPTSAAGAATCPNAALTGSLNVFAAASLTEAFTEQKVKLEGACKDLHITNNFAGSQALVTQIQNGADADVFASADQKNMTTLVDANLVNTPQVFATNQLEIAVAPGNPKHIASLADT